MNRDRPFRDTLRWVLIGVSIGLLIFIGHRLLVHNKSTEDDHNSFDESASVSPQAQSFYVHAAAFERRMRVT